jgi:hypothetical protein
VNRSTQPDHKKLLVCTASLTSDRNKSLATAFAERHDAVLLADPELDVSEAALAALTEVWSAHPNCVVGCRTVDADQHQRLQFPGWRWSPQDARWRGEWFAELKADPTASATTECEVLSPETILVARDIWEIVGPFDSELSFKYAVIDWCHRVRQAGFSCLEARNAAVFLKRPPPTRYDGKVTAYLSTLPDTLRIAGRWGQPYPRYWMVLRLLRQSVVEETARVRFWVDYGVHLSIAKRSVWYFRNLITAVTRERVMVTIRLGIISCLTGGKSKVDR